MFEVTWLVSIELLYSMTMLLISVDGWSPVRQVVVDFRRYVFLSNVYLNFFSICINYHIMNKQISLNKKKGIVNQLIEEMILIPALASSGSGTRRYLAGSTETL